MTQSVNPKKTTSNGSLKSSNGSERTNAKSAGKHSPKPTQAHKAKRSRPSAYAVPSWLGALASVIGVSVAIGAGLYATRDQWMPKAGKWKDDFSAAFADDETDHENFDQTRHAGKDSMRDPSRRRFRGASWSTGMESTMGTGQWLQADGYSRQWRQEDDC